MFYYRLSIVYEYQQHNAAETCAEDFFSSSFSLSILRSATVFLFVMFSTVSSASTTFGCCWLLRPWRNRPNGFRIPQENKQNIMMRCRPIKLDHKIETISYLLLLFSGVDFVASRLQHKLESEHDTVTCLLQVYARRLNNVTRIYTFTRWNDIIENNSRIQFPFAGLWDIWRRQRPPLAINRNLFSFQIKQCDRRIITVERSAVAVAFYRPPTTPNLIHTDVRRNAPNADKITRVYSFRLIFSFVLFFLFFFLCGFRLYYFGASCVLSSPIRRSLVLMCTVWPHFVHIHFENCSLELFLRARASSGTRENIFMFALITNHLFDARLPRFASCFHFVCFFRLFLSVCGR